MINFTRKFTYIHIPKTAGSSIRPALLKAYRARGDKIVNTNSHAKQKKLNQIIDNKGLTSEMFFMFCFVRNPWDRFLSEYFYCKQIVNKRPHLGYISKHKFNDLYPTFKHWIENKGWRKTSFPGHADEQISYLNDMTSDVSFIGRFENLQDDFNIVCDKIGIPRQQLPHKNKSKHKHYTEYYDDKTRQIVAERYSKDIEYFGYKFGD